MQQDISESAYDSIEQGFLVSPDGTSFLRRGTRAKRKDVDALVESGSPVVVHWAGGLPERTQVIWHDQDALRVWSELRTSHLSTDPNPSKGEAVTAGRWVDSDDHVVVLLTWHH